MSWNVVEVRMIDVSYLRTSPVDEERVNESRQGTGGFPFELRLKSMGPGTDGVEISIVYEGDGDDALTRFYVPDESWKTFVKAVKCVDQMRDMHEST